MLNSQLCTFSKRILGRYGVDGQQPNDQKKYRRCFVRKNSCV